ncbi:MAG TPA: hypothetical protein VGD81_13150 [Opitutaceae bacterium]
MIPDAIAPGGTPSATPVAPADTPQVRSKQDQQLADALADAHNLIKAALDSPALIEVLSPAGYDEAELNAGLALWAAAQEKYDARQTADAECAQTKADRDKLLNEMRAEFMAYRVAVQVDYKGVERAALGASGRVPGDLERLQTSIRAAYAAGQKDPYAAKLAKSGFTIVRLQKGVAGVALFSASDTLFKQHDRAVTDATATRDKAAGELKAWVAKFRKLAKSNLQDHPSLRAKLGV